MAKRRVLVVHQDSSLQVSLATLLAQAGYAVEAADRASPETVQGLDVVVVAAPEGAELARGIKGGVDTARTQVVGVAPGPVEALQADWFAAGADELLPLPIEGPQFLDVLAQLLDIRDVAATLDVGAESVADALASVHKR